MDRHTYYQTAFSRNIGLFSKAEQDRLASARAAVAGMGGVGGLHLITLTRMGIGKFHLADFDRFEPVNVNRQYGAKVPHFGRPKLDVMVEEALAVNPFLEIETFPEGVTEANLNRFLEGVHVVLDGLDFFNFDIRRLLFNRARERGLYVITAGPLGFSSALLVFSPHEGMTFDEYFDIREGLSEEERLLRFSMGLAPRPTHLAAMDFRRVSLREKTGPSLASACQLCASVAATEAVRILLGRGPVQAVPKYLQIDPYSRVLRRGTLHWGNRNPIQKVKMFVVKRILLEDREDPKTAETRPVSWFQRSVRRLLPRSPVFFTDFPECRPRPARPLFHAGGSASEGGVEKAYPAESIPRPSEQRAATSPAEVASPDASDSPPVSVETKHLEDRSRAPLRSADPSIPDAVFRYILEAGVQAPSGDNAQPWKFSLDKNHIHVLVDRDRDRSFFNVDQVASVISCGAVVENIRIAATSFGLETRVEGFPKSENPDLAATLRFEPADLPADPLHEVIWKRCTNRKSFASAVLSPLAVDALEAALGDFPDARLHWVLGRNGLGKLARIVHRADRIRTEDRRLHEHLHRMVRFSDDEARSTFDGFPLKNLEAGLAGEIFLRLTRPWPVMNTLNRLGASKAVASHAARAVRHAAGAALLTVSGCDLPDFLRGGRALQRAWLTATALGVSLQPMAAVTLFWTRRQREGLHAFLPRHRRLLERVFAGYQELFPEVDFPRAGHVLLFRLGVAPPIDQPTFRRPVETMLERREAARSGR